ncbi:hypothetical protein NG800_007175 [Epilithonimonas ginsengisoli]|uniref:Uncharacterized protein n=1 Tax=Epilithonimonas ginsengisoli TaxID=1245592 RepID=A0ABU4JGP0_9FLAO|nr:MULTISPECIES: hypothetical protein [Chryseobacterium group]MBV6880036.1 hypothetical protein [Epilithonimonas sp. FP105]MDW8548686.1 hypothetical protein [Epilithonimonas ginsengisoli]OAH75059.1 hypothetical protein AXA65_05105 [Chryseobacterium sp. FP211-J200]
MFKINKGNYDNYKFIFTIIWEFQVDLMNIDLNPEYSPINILNKWEKESEAKARRGLREGLIDTLTGLKDLPNELLIELNLKLTSYKLPTIEILTSQIKNLPAKILSRGIIKNITEYYIIKEVLDDLDYSITDTERQELTIILFEFEKKQIIVNKKLST